MNDVYYKIYLDKDDLITIVELQEFDEPDYDHSRFFMSCGKEITFMTEEHAIEYLNKHFKPECIDPLYLDYSKHTNYLFRDKLKNG